MQNGVFTIDGYFVAVANNTLKIFDYLDGAARWMKKHGLKISGEEIKKKGA